MLTYNRKVITHNDKWFNEFKGHPEPIYHVYTSAEHGQVIATPNEGIYGTYITLSNVPASGYEFVNYSITGAPWYNRESFYLQHNDAHVEGHFRYIVPDYALRICNKLWTKYNISIDDGGTGIKKVDNVTANGVNFGTQYYYTLEAAERIANLVGNGWRIPTDHDWDELARCIGAYTAGTQLKSTSGWDDDGNGTDNYGFTALPVGGILSSGLNPHKQIGEHAEFVTIGEEPLEGLQKLYYRTLAYNRDGIARTWTSDSNKCLSLRLVRDVD